MPNAKTNSRKSPTEKGDRKGVKVRERDVKRVKCGGEGEKR